MKRPKFHPVHDDYYAVVIEDGSWLEYASTDQFWELFEYTNWLEKDHQRLRDTNYSLLKQLGDKDVEINGLKDILKDVQFEYERGLETETWERIKQVLKC